MGNNFSTMNDKQGISEILDFWFGELDDRGMCEQARNKLWFQSDASGDRYILDNFGSLVTAALQGELDHWADEGRGLVALVLLLDQFTRNIYRGTPSAFAGDEAARSLVEAALKRGTDQQLPAIYRVFLYIPFEHAEDMDSQQTGIGCMDALLDSCAESASERIAGFRQYSVAHRDVIARFGRFPHRNSILGRKSSQEELDHLQTHGGF
jgi:uncharacterized protein (DUF924 family)